MARVEGCCWRRSLPGTFWPVLGTSHQRPGRVTGVGSRKPQQHRGHSGYCGEVGGHWRLLLLTAVRPTESARGEKVLPGAPNASRSAMQRTGGPGPGMTHLGWDTPGPLCPEELLSPSLAQPCTGDWRHPGESDSLHKTEAVSQRRRQRQKE